MRVHIKCIAWLHIVFGSLFALACLAGGLFWMLMGAATSSAMTGAANHPADPTGFNTDAVFNAMHHSIVLTGVIVITIGLLWGVGSLIAGIGLLRLAPWSRMLGIIVSAAELLLLNPLHIALGIYGLVILNDREAIALLQGGSLGSPRGVAPTGQGTL